MTLRQVHDLKQVCDILRRYHLPIPPEVLARLRGYQAQVNEQVSIEPGSVQKENVANGIVETGTSSQTSTV